MVLLAYLAAAFREGSDRNDQVLGAEPLKARAQGVIVVCIVQNNLSSFSADQIGQALFKTLKPKAALLRRKRRCDPGPRVLGEGDEGKSRVRWRQIGEVTPGLSGGMIGVHLILAELLHSGLFFRVEAQRAQQRRRNP